MYDRQDLKESSCRSFCGRGMSDKQVMFTIGDAVYGQLKTGKDLLHLFTQTAGGIKAVGACQRSKGLLAVQDISGKGRKFSRRAGIVFRHEDHGGKGVPDQPAELCVIGGKAEKCSAALAFKPA